MSALAVFAIGGYNAIAEVATAVEGHADVHDVASAREVIAFLAENPDVRVPLVIVNSDSVEPVSTLAELYADPRLADARNVVLTSSREHRDLAPAIDAGHLHALVRIPATGGAMPVFVTSQLHQWMDAHGLDPIPVVEAPALHSTTSADFLDELEASDDELTEQFVDAIDEVMERRPRIFLPPGVRLTRQGQEVTGVYVVIKGNVALTRSTPSENLLLHHASTGRVVGILSLVGQKKAFFTSTTTTDCEVIAISIDQLDSALRRDPKVSLGLAVAAIRGLAQRLRRSEELQVERNELNWKLGREQKRLAKALKDLEEARLELVSQAKFATLGELSAGVAHELNNPVAALSTAADHISADVGTILQSHPKGQLLSEVSALAQNHAPISTAEEREIRRRLEKITKDPEMSFRLVAAGVTEPDVARKLSKVDLQLIEAAASLGTAARNIKTASTRITELVHSLKSYARPEIELVNDVDVHETIDDALTLVAHRLRGVEVIRDYGAIEKIRAHPSQLGQIWTNLMVNAVEALQDGGRITISTSMADPETAQIEVTDNGPGIPEELVEKVFEPRFTTKQGTIRFGMGLGLGLTRSLVEGHEGSVAVSSEPGRTTFTIHLPVAGPMMEEQ